MSDELLPPEVADRIGPFYVYVLVDPRDGLPFYVGKGTGSRLLAHGREAGLKRYAGDSPNSKVNRIREIRDVGFEPRIDIVTRGILDEPAAFRFEAALIDCLDDFGTLTNSVGGQNPEGPRIPLDEAIAQFGAQDLAATEPPVLLIRLRPSWIEHREQMERGYFRYGSGWYPTIDEETLLDATRGWWSNLSPSRLEERGVGHVVSVVQGVTRAVYRIERWIGPRKDGRRAFIGSIVRRGPVFDSYVGELGKRIAFPKGAQSPWVYWPRSATR